MPICPHEPAWTSMVMVAPMWSCVEGQDSPGEAALVTGSSWSLCLALRESESLTGTMHAESLP